MFARSILAASVQPVKPIAARMHKKLTESLKPSVLNIIDESHKHAGHAHRIGSAAGGPDAESHFKLEIVSEAFQGKRLVQRHQMVYQLLDQEIKDGVHALSMVTKTPDEGK